MSKTKAERTVRAGRGLTLAGGLTTVLGAMTLGLGGYFQGTEAAGTGIGILFAGGILLSSGAITWGVGAVRLRDANWYIQLGINPPVTGSSGGASVRGRF